MHDINSKKASLEGRRVYLSILFLIEYCKENFNLVDWLIKYITDDRLEKYVQNSWNISMAKNNSDIPDLDQEAPQQVHPGVGSSFMNLLNNQSGNLTEAGTGSNPAAPTIDLPSASGDSGSAFMNLINSQGESEGDSSIGGDTTSSTGPDLGNIGGNFSGSSIIDGTKASFVIGIISKWYMLIVVAAMAIAYNVLKILYDKGILQALYDNVNAVLKALTQASVDCPQYIEDVGRFFQCLGW